MFFRISLNKICYATESQHIANIRKYVYLTYPFTNRTDQGCIHTHVHKMKIALSEDRKSDCSIFEIRLK